MGTSILEQSIYNLPRMINFLATRFLSAMQTLIVGVIVALSVGEARGQCVNSATPSCAVYASCFASACNCEGQSAEYFLSYGKKYCTTFLELPGLSDEGSKWRNSTLRCLQETIVPQLPVNGAACNCSAMQTLAFDSHVSCYTQKGASICSLPPSDWAKIVGAVGLIETLSDAKGRKQLYEVAKICLPIAGSGAKALIQKVLDHLAP
jgi:hypothetical protein